MSAKEEPVLLEERIISNLGLIVHDPNADIRRFWLQVDVIRFPQLNFVSKKTNPDESDYGRITWMRQGQVLRVDRIRFDTQTYIWDVDASGYIAKFLLCAFQSTFNLLEAIAITVGASVSPGADLFCDPIYDQFDQIKFVVRPDAAIAVKLYALKYDIACTPAEPNPQPPPPPPQFPQFPPGTELRDTEFPASPPYLPPNDLGDTVPLPEDIATPEPVQGVWNITWTYVQTPGLSPCPFLGTPDVIVRSGLSTDEFGLIDEGTGGQRIWRLTQNGVPDPTALVEYRCTPTFEPPPSFTAPS